MDALNLSTQTKEDDEGKNIYLLSFIKRIYICVCMFENTNKRNILFRWK